MRAVRMLLLTAALTVSLLAQKVQADGEKSGAFDYYVMALSWSPTWCRLEGDRKSAPQCDPREDFGWVLHGMWPQYHQGWPAFCPTAEPQPTRAMTDSLTGIMGTPGMAWYQWKKHGVCSGLSAAQYFDLSRRAYAQIHIPQAFAKLKQTVKLPASLIEQAFLEANPALTPDMLTITCTAGYIHEVRVCLSKTLLPVPCGRDVIRDCTLKGALFDPVR